MLTSLPYLETIPLKAQSIICGVFDILVMHQSERFFLDSSNFTVLCGRFQLVDVFSLVNVIRFGSIERWIKVFIK
jgi:hypothetical protein